MELPENLQKEVILITLGSGMIAGVTATILSLIGVGEVFSLGIGIGVGLIFGEKMRK